MITVNEEKAESKSTTIQKTLDKKDEAKSEVKVKKVLSNVSEELNKKIEETARSPKSLKQAEVLSSQDIEDSKESGTKAYAKNLEKLVT